RPGLRQHLPTAFPTETSRKMLWNRADTHPARRWAQAVFDTPRKSKDLRLRLRRRPYAPPFDRQTSSCMTLSWCTPFCVESRLARATVRPRSHVCWIVNSWEISFQKISCGAEVSKVATQQGTHKRYNLGRVSSPVTDRGVRASASCRTLLAAVWFAAFALISTTIFFYGLNMAPRARMLYMLLPSVAGAVAGGLWGRPILDPN